ncbi:hypothetical protein FB566_3423 [Stackebrandtia endophytica]|uniref:DUF3592 domain-containing protein n=1 Tax=Stackebrandtia endophytica TaxID=1496996 RepID=A0A543AZ50_9ACTN|nr:hypothetical protein [Stackebrandtia endophytica]TQL77855.1 hypothetical protein FB566_3423 [Stackebrandtia endophytica]
MLLPDELAALQAAEARYPRNRLIVIIVTLVLTFVPAAIYLPGAGNLDHLLGKDEQVDAVVESVNTNGSCRKPRRTRYVIEVRWESSFGSGSDTYTQCGNPPTTGSSVQVWVGPSGEVSRNSPTADLIGLTAISLGVAAFTAGIGFVIIITSRRQRQRVLQAGVMTLAAPVAVEVSRGQKSTVLMRHLPPQPHPPGRNTQIGVVLYAQQGSTPTTRTPRNIAGSWWMYLAPPVHKSKRNALLYRGQERCWIDFTPPKR